MKTILIVEDNEGFRGFIADFLRWRSFHVIEAADGVQGWELAIENKPDLILSDIYMPRLNGYQLLERLQQDLDAAMIPVVLLATHATLEERDRALQLGAADLLSKPTLPARILGTISTCLRGNLQGHRNSQR
ncbi:MAG TPA: response regulator [Oscillatoriales cyanobacterium M59_W2019_021]|nr:MAG: response regulator [Cyanobacteria bacterium J055]HIK31075.1 response regulator [Oscillatoriales cyanobacterium M4454_W2019_049]HIK51145.1 response regulator [Oscillatoriales cyanobacterium M59_W2019_021]